MAKVVYNKLLFYQVSIFLVLYVGYGFYYYTRKSIVFMLPHFDRANTSGINSIQISKNDIGIIISSQNTAYALSKLIGGFLTDVVSCRILFGAGLLLSGLFNIAFKKDIQIYMIYALSFLIGLAQGAGWPCCGKLLQNWFSPKKLGTFWSILSTSANVAGAIGPLVATSIALKYHWSYGFMIPGCICMTVGYLSLIILRNRPSEIGLEDFDSSVDENISTLYKNDGKTDEDASSLSSIDSESEDEEEELGALQRTKLYLNYSYFISICLSFFIVTLIKTLMSDWSQVYLIKSIRVDHYNASYFVSLFELSGIIGSVVSGILTDYIFSRQSTAKKPMESIRIRMTVNLVYIFILVVSLHLFTFYLQSTSNRLLLFTIAFLMGFLCYGSVNLLGICAMEFAPNKYSGSSHAVAALAANIGAVFAGIPFGFLSKIYSWSFAFLCVELLSIFIGLFSFLARNRMCKFEIISRERKIK